MLAEGSLASNGKRKKRVGTACDFCRQRKLGCDNAKPKCENCRTQGKSCIYSERMKNIRPTNTQIRRLEEENAQLRRSLARTRSQMNVERMPDTQDRQQSISVHEENNSVHQLRQMPVSRSAPDQDQACFSTGDREVQFHGPSSAMFDESNQQATESLTSGITADPLQRYQLLGACIKQRQMEPIDLAAGKLDFDGLDPESGMHLLSVFWSRQHASGSIVYRPAFMRDMACNGPYFSKLLLNAIYFVASKNATMEEFRCEVTDGPVRISPFRQRAEKLLYNNESGNPLKGDITTIQALLIMSDALFTWCDERSLSWSYSGLAMNMIIGLGIHVDSRIPSAKNRLSAEDIEVRRRLFWAAFVADKVQSIYQGRPVRIREVDINVPIFFMDDYEELEQFSALSYDLEESPISITTHSVSVFEQLCKLSIIMEKIISSIYTEKSRLKDPNHHLGVAKSLHAELNRWRNALPDHLIPKLSNPSRPSLTPHAFSLMSVFHSLVILLHRPFVSDGHIRSTSASVVRDSFATCATAASEIDATLRLYRQHFCIMAVPYFMSYATYVSATIHVRIAAQSGPGSEAYLSLQHCLDILSLHQNVCRAPRRARQILVGLARRLNVQINDKGSLGTGGIQNCGTGDNVDTMTIPNTQAFDNGINFMGSDLDIDAIIESFDFERSGIANFSSAKQFEQNTYTVSGENQNPSNDQMLLESDELGGSSEEWPFYAPLFGFSSL
ncbi:putative nitrogen assimilation transcription factor nirA [Talaromyces proteolyticus]|uniref:Nitrogen assimilation transcription factor nirA n=1 Tax=Talaromyces proteolyticus TaxID=1131652 RepID=A0AAD4KET7_9EURO|nr:putative nitrogen assimilation transcription factor nirA [Talaromyces proteolyticus]KAH8689158.1 putative nitrogen assimilation transcription factor nirA [Talaromyces proteolyticus]